MSFCHLHVHTEYSLLDGACKIKKAIQKAVDMGQKAIAITDHGVMYGCIDFYKEAKAAGIKPILGCEVYVAPNSRFQKEKVGKPSHLILLAKDNLGYKNLCKICSAGWTEGFYGKPRIDWEILSKYHEGIICLSACLAGIVPQTLLHGSFEDAVAIAKKYQDLFKDDYYIEIQDHNLPEDPIVIPGLIKVANAIGAKVVATNDSHYLDKEDYKMHEILLCLQTGKTLSDQSRMRFATNEFYLKSTEEMSALFSYIPEAIENTQEVADKCNVEFTFGEIKLPDYPIPEGYSGYRDYFEALCHKGMLKRYGENCPQEYWDRLNYEINIIDKMGFIGYYLIVWDYINFAKLHDIPVGPGRGSGAGSIAAYAIEITNIDPMKYGLLFERFLNPERLSMPDFDVDFCYNRRHEVIDYVTQLYGADRVSQIITFGTMAAKNSIRDVARVMEVPYSKADSIAKMIPTDPKITISKAMEINPELQAAYSNDLETMEIIDMAKKLEGTPRHTSKHAAGVLIADNDITEYAPLMTADDEAVIQFPMTTLEELGLVKMDVRTVR